MTPPCIFCDNESGSEEHLWPNWMHRFMKEHGINLGALRVQEGSGPETIEDDLEKTINTVCHTCNNAWMSGIEDKNVPRLKTMLQNIPLTIDPGGMKMLTQWAVKTAMVQDSIKPRIGNENFYTREERVAMREKLQIPARTRVWIGALDEFHLGSHGTDFTILANGGKTRIGTGCANTIYTGYFVVQVVTEHIYPEYQGPDIPEIQPPPGISRFATDPDLSGGTEKGRMAPRTIHQRRTKRHRVSAPSLAPRKKGVYGHENERCGVRGTRQVFGRSGRFRILDGSGISAVLLISYPVE